MIDAGCVPMSKSKDDNDSAFQNKEEKSSESSPKVQPNLAFPSRSDFTISLMAVER